MDIIDIIKLVICIAIGLGFSMYLQSKSNQKIAREMIEQQLGDNLKIANMYRHLYMDAMETKDKRRAKQAMVNNHCMCPDKSDECLKTKFCTECPLRYGWLNMKDPEFIDDGF